MSCGFAIRGSLTDDHCAERYGIRPNLLTAWRRRQTQELAVSKSKRKRARFAAVRIKPMAADGTIEIDQVNRLIRVHGIVDVGMPREVLAAIQRSDYPMARAYGSHPVSPICAMGSMALPDSCRPSFPRIHSRVSSSSFVAGAVTACK
jgi:hypothetical protein